MATLPGAWVSTGTGWSGVSILRLGNLQLISLCGSTYNCLSRSVPEIHKRVAVTLSSQPTNQQTPVVFAQSCSCNQQLRTGGLGTYQSHSARTSRYFPPFLKINHQLSFFCFICFPIFLSSRVCAVLAQSPILNRRSKDGGSNDLFLCVSGVQNEGNVPHSLCSVCSLRTASLA